MISLALIGRRISHSRSQEVYEKILGQQVNYDLLDCQSVDILPQLYDLKKYDGISITSPYKRYYVDKVFVGKEEGLLLQSINCIRFEGEQSVGINTDLLAMKELIPKMIKGRATIVILGNGVMAELFVHLFNQMNVSFHHRYRGRDHDISNIDFSDYSNGLVINCCSRTFLFQGNISPSALFWDMNYASDDQGEQIKSQGGSYVDGLELLEKQAWWALKFWQILK